MARCLGYLKQLGHEDSATEIRIIGAALYRGQLTRRSKANISGYYDAAHYPQAVQDGHPYNGIGNIYATLNPVAPDRPTCFGPLRVRLFGWLNTIACPP